jgi:hypothetical protein
MRDLLDIQEKLQDTGAMIATVERQLAEYREERGLAINLASLQKRHAQLEREFDAAASQLGMDVCRYRILPELSQVKLLGLTSALSDYQSLISIVFAAVSGGPKQTAKVSAEILAQTALDFGYSFPGSVGFAFTVPNERLLLIEGNLDEAIRLIGQAAKAQSSAEIRESARRLGIGPIRVLYRWAEGHVKARLSAEIEWRRGKEVRSSLLMQEPEFEILQRAIAETSDEEQREISLTGILIAVDVARRTFRLEPDTGGQTVSGAFAQAIDSAHPVEVPKRYHATLRQTKRVKYSTEEEQVEYELIRLDPASEQVPV